ncbi:hypothetical protein KCP70_01435 [Salmonella enterica subsp. enterica]|nr:hypothetical protein KCP70_01435 [Salmonella enterica subsp. enterica]
MKGASVRGNQGQNKFNPTATTGISGDYVCAGTPLLIITGCCSRISRVTLNSPGLSTVRAMALCRNTVWPRAHLICTAWRRVSTSVAWFAAAIIVVVRTCFWRDKSPQIGNPPKYVGKKMCLNVAFSPHFAHVCLSYGLARERSQSQGTHPEGHAVETPFVCAASLFAMHLSPLPRLRGRA